ncbi:MAG: hypothetical protein J1F29_02585 [Lentimicrobiaceae bacterium]|nr:hypothetical protein [Lentimicrobiaceae bacterium]
MTIYRVLNNKTKEYFDFDTPEAALDYAELFNGRRSAHIIEMPEPGISIDMGEMKYEILHKESKTLDLGSHWHKVYRIRALRDFTTYDTGSVKAGDLGGWVESYDNLDQNGNCWLFDDAAVCRAAAVREDAVMRGNAAAFDRADISGRACVYDKVYIYNFARIEGHAQVKGISHIHGSACIRDHAYVEDANIRFGPDNCAVGGTATVIGAGTADRLLYIDNLCGGKKSLTAYSTTFSAGNVCFDGRHFESYEEFAKYVDKTFFTSVHRDQMKTVVELIKAY